MFCHNCPIIDLAACHLLYMPQENDSTTHPKTLKIISSDQAIFSFVPIPVLFKSRAIQGHDSRLAVKSACAQSSCRNIQDACQVLLIVCAVPLEHCIKVSLASHPPPFPHYILLIILSHRYIEIKLFQKFTRVSQKKGLSTLFANSPS